MSSAALTIPTDCHEYLPRLAIVIQGPVIEKDSFTIESVRLYKRRFPGATIIVSTWHDTSDRNIRECKDVGADVLLNERPAFAGISNINMQITSSRSGVLRARDLGAEYVMKTRADQRIFAPNVAEYLFHMTEAFPLPDDVKLQKRRIIGINLNTFKYRMYGLSDMLLYGHVEDMCKYWDVELDERAFTEDELYKATESIGAFARARICEVYLATEFLRKVGHNPLWTLEDSWRAFSRYFLIVDKEQLDFYWHKYNRYEYRWVLYDSPVRQQLDFRDWLNISRSLGCREVPEHMLLEES